MSGRGDDAHWRNDEAERYNVESARQEALSRELEKFKKLAFGVEPEKLPPMSGPVTMEDGDDVNHPAHYAANGPKCPHCGENIECITITENMGFCLGNTVKYIWRRKEKGAPLKDLKKARWYLDREISKLEAE